MKPTIYLLFTLGFFAALHRAAAQAPFVLSTSLTNGNQIWSVTTADVNNDGKPDLISAIYTLPGYLCVWTNSGNGLFVSNASYTVGSGPVKVVAADVNNDDKPDLITADFGSNSLTVLTNDGNGGFVLADTLGLDSSPFSVAAADLFGNGRQDLISASQNQLFIDSFTVWSNSGGGIFVSNLTLSASGEPHWVTTADVNGDGKLDIIGACENYGASNSLYVWTNNGAGGYAPTLVPTNLPGAFCVAAADIDGDGKPDLILCASALDVLTNNGSGGFAFAYGYSLPANSFPRAVVAADVNGDEQVDLITCNQGNGTLTVLTNNSGSFLQAYTLAVGGSPVSLTAADVNGDGRLDLISASFSSGVLTVLTNASTFLPRLTLKTSGSNVIVTWPAIWANWTLRQNTSLDPDTWTSFSGPIGNDGATKSATNSTLEGNLFFRLSNP